MHRLATFFIFLFPLFSFAQSLFQRTYGTASSEERAFDLVILPDHSIITIGDRYETSTFLRTGHLVKVNGNGDQEWVREIAGNEDIYGTAICQLTNGNVLAAGYDYDVPNQEYGLMVATFQSGNGLPVYQKTHQFDQRTKAVAAVPSASNGAYILCEYGTSSNHTNLLCEVDAAGDTLWSKILNPYPNSETPTDIELLSDGLIITGSVEGTSSGTENRFFIQTDLQGNIIWENEDDVAAMEIGGKMCINPNGGFYSVATTRVPGTSYFKMLGSAVDENGSVLWSETYGQQTDRIDFGYSVAPLPDGGAVFVGSGFQSDTSNFRDLFLVRTDAAGTPVWEKFYGGWGADVGYEVRMDGEFIVAAGKADVNNSEDVLILRADLNGNTTVGIMESSASSGIRAFPNPFIDLLTIEPIANPLSLPLDFHITDITGKTLWEGSVSKAATYNLSWLPAGTYFIRLGDFKAIRIVKIS